MKIYMKKIGIYGGTFNPLHIVHLIIAERFTAQVGLDRCFFIPAFISPFKTEEETGGIDSTHRVNMVKLAIEGNPKFSICTYEIDKGGISYTYDTLQYLKGLYPNAEFYILTGMDQAIEFKRWKNWEQILGDAFLCIACRPETMSPESERFINSLSVNNRIIRIDTPVSNLSSTYLRQLIRNGQRVKYLVPDRVENYINDNKLYR